MALFPAVYRGQAVSINGSTIKALVPQVFGDTPVTVRDFLGVMPTSRTDGWIFFQGGNPSYPVWGGNLAVGGTGPPGPPGPAGPPGTSVMQRGYRFDNRTTASDPGSGVLRLNTVDPATTTLIYLSVYERDGSIVPGITALASGDSFWLYESSNINSSVQYNVTGASVVSSDGQWATVPVSSVQNKGFTPTNNQNIEVYLSIEPAANYATTTYVDNRIDGVSWKTPCDLATTTNIDLTAPPRTIDGVDSWSIGIGRVLVKNQTNQAQNGIYIMQTPWVRDSDFDKPGHVQGAVVFVQQGTANHDTIWYVSAPDSWPTLGTTPIVWTQFQGGSGGGTNEVWIGTDDPIVANPTIELWYDSDDDPAATDRANFWNSAWGMVARQDYGDNITLNAAGQVVAALTFTAVPGRQYRVHMYCPLIVNAGSNISFDIYSNGTQVAVGGGWLASGASYDARYLTWPLWRAGSFSGTQALQIKVGSYNSTAMNFYREALWVEDLGPITKAAVNPPDGQPQIATAGNALGIVAMGSLNTAVTSLPQSTVTQITNNLSVTMLTGRRYRVFFGLRAMTIAAGTTATTINIQLRNGTTFIPDNAGPWTSMMGSVGAYMSFTYEWLFDGDGTTKNLNVTLNPSSTAVSAYPSIQGYFYVEDVGPNQSPALPIPDTPPGWTPITAFTNGWQNFDTTRTAQYRKIGDEVTMRGVLKGGTVGYGTPMFNLPSGFRPPTGRDEDWVVRAAGAPANLTVFANGNVSVTDNASGASATYVYLNGVRWSVTA